MSAFELSWYLKIDKQRNCGVNPKATLQDSLPQIKTALDHSGIVSISLVDCPQFAPRRLKIQSTNGNSTLTLGDIDNQYQRVKGYSTNYPLPKAANDDERAIGSDKQMVCSKPETIYEIVEEFFNTGNVTGEWLN